MSVQEILRRAISSTQGYLELLEQQDLGIERLQVNRQFGAPIRDLTALGENWKVVKYSCVRYRRIAPETFAHYVDRSTGGVQDCLIVSYDRSIGELELAFQGNHPPQGDGVLEIDLRWLVRQFLQWFQERGSTLKSPFGRSVKSQLMTANDLQDLDLDGPPLSDGQKNAVLEALVHPVAYIWGPPGSGKTHHVLAAMVLALLDSGKRILVTGPTNTAVDNAVEALLRQLPDQEHHSVVRLGIPSIELLAEHPEVCEDEALKQQLADLSKKIESLDALLSRYAEVGRAAVETEKLERHLVDNQKEMETLTISLKNLETKRADLARQHTLATAEKRQLEANFERSKGARDEVPLFSRLIGSRYRTAVAEVERLGSLLAASSRSLRELEVNLGDCVTQLAREAQRLNNCEETARAIAERLEKLHQVLREAPGQMGALSVQQLRDIWEAKNAEKQALIHTRAQLSMHLDDKKVIALTLDMFVSRFRTSSPRIDWVCLDEAGYAHLIKLLPLLSLQCPITLFGDHKQLQPVFEPKGADQEIRQFWARSAIAIDELWEANRLGGGQPHQPMPEIFFKRTHKSTLRESHRFSDALAKALDQHVYEEGLSGLAKEGTRISFVDIHPQNAGHEEKRVNVEEVNAIVRLLKERPELPNESLAVLTPYKNQVRAIQWALRRAGLESAEVINVHRAQGREWDTVILSVVDGSQPECAPWFTTTRRKEGKTVINTAISRVRRQLIIVAEGRYWRLREGELLGTLMGMATPV